MKALLLIAMVSIGVSVGIAQPASATPDYIKKYWEARHHHAEQPSQGAAASAPASKR